MRRLGVLAVVSALIMSLVTLVGSRTVQVGAQDATPGASPSACPITTPEQNETLVRNFLELVYNQKRLDLVDPMLTDDFVRHNTAHPTDHPTGTPAPHNADDAALIGETVRTTFPDFHITINDMVAAGDQVAALTTATGTHKGPYRVSGGATVPPSGLKVEYTGISIYRIRCGQIAELWAVSDNLTVLRQIGSLSNAELESIGSPDITPPRISGATPAAPAASSAAPAGTAAAGSPVAGCPTTTPAQNEAIVRGFLEDVYNQKQLDKVAQYLADDFAHHTGVEARPYAQVSGTADDEAAVRNTVTVVFPDFQSTIDTTIASGDRVAVMVTSSGTQKGPIAVAGGVTVPGTDLRVYYTAMVIYRIQCGKIAEAWNVTDNLTLLRQVGAISNSEIESLATPEVATPAP